MKQIIIIAAHCCYFVLLANTCFSQDILMLKNGDEVKAKVLEINTTSVVYKKWDNQSGPTYTSAKSEIFKIKYTNGTQDVFKMDDALKAVSSEASPEEARKTQAVNKLEQYVKNLISRSDVIEFTSFKKTNGVLQNMYGQSVYNVAFDVQIHFKRRGFLVGNGLEGYWRNNFYVYPAAPDLSASGQQYMYTVKAIEQGNNFILGCKSTMTGSDNGFEVKELSIASVTTLTQSLGNNAGSEKSNTPSENVANTKILNTRYTQKDLTLIEELINMNMIPNAPKEYFIDSFINKTIFGKTRIWFQQSPDAGDLLYGSSQKGKKETLHLTYMYYKGLIFYNSSILTEILYKSETGVVELLFDGTTHQRLTPISYNLLR
jgi:hypothetical protein